MTFHTERRSRSCLTTLTVTPATCSSSWSSGRAASEDGDRDAAIQFERTIVAALARADDGTGEARATIGAAFTDALHAGSEGSALQVLTEQLEPLEEAVQVLDDNGVRARRRPVAIPAITGEYPPSLLALAGKPGSVVSEGSVGVVSGAGGTAKTTLMLNQALVYAHAPPGEATQLHGGIFDAPTGGGPVLHLTFENEDTVARDPVLALVDQLDRGRPSSFREAAWRVHVLDMMNCPVFGPTERGAAAGLYNARPGPLAGWVDLEHAIEEVRPRLVIIDPVLCAYVGDANSTPAVREFLGALASLARSHRLGVILIAHSTKAARKSGDPMDVGQIGGTDHWTSGVRGTFSLSYDESIEGGRVLACPKANRGPDRLLLPLDPIRGSNGEPLGFVAADGQGWRPPPAKDERSRALVGAGENPHA